MPIKTDKLIHNVEAGQDEDFSSAFQYGLEDIDESFDKPVRALKISEKEESISILKEIAEGCNNPSAIRPRLSF